MQPVAGASTQQLPISSMNGQQQPAPQQPSRITRYAGLVADDFRCVGKLNMSLQMVMHGQRNWGGRS